MEHNYEKELMIESGLAYCNICGLAEGSLTTDCSGQKVSSELEEKVYGGKKDFREGIGWCNLPNPTNQSLVKAAIFKAIRENNLDTKFRNKTRIRFGIPKSEYVNIEKKCLAHVYK